MLGRELTLQIKAQSVVVSALASINVVNGRWARSVLGWVTVCWWVNHLGVQQVIYINSAFYPYGVGKWSTGLSGWG